MQWDLGLSGLLYLAGMSLVFGVLAALLVGRGAAFRVWAGVITTAACFGVGLFVSEVMFGWATEEELQPNIDGLSRDEALLSSVLTTAIVVLAMRYLAHRSKREASYTGWHVRGSGRHHHA
jgi:formate hydrogenlyase subunit 3/multisubunit Na+/H+ antiporter MnhD subunit